jgi:YHS domain-containing protein
MLKIFLGLMICGCVLVAASAFVGADEKKDAASTQPSTAPSTQASDKPINKYCAVEKENEIDAKGGTYVYKGKTIGFCCPDCVDEFKKDPEKYMKNLK